MKTRCKFDDTLHAIEGAQLAGFLRLLTAHFGEDFGVWMPLLGSPENVYDTDSGFWVLLGKLRTVQVLLREQTPDVGMSDVIPTADTFFWKGPFEKLELALMELYAKTQKESSGSGSVQHLLSVFLSHTKGVKEVQSQSAEEALLHFNVDFEF